VSLYLTGLSDRLHQVVVQPREAVAIQATGECPPGVAPARNKKADVAEYPEVFDHIGLLYDEPSSYAGVLFI